MEISSHAAIVGEPQRKKLLAASRPPILRDIKSIRTETIHTSSALPISDDHSLIFDVPAQEGYYVDMSGIKLHIRYKLLRKGRGNVTESDEVVPLSSILYTMFKDLQVNFNNRTVFWGRFLYGFYMNFLLTFKTPRNEKTMLYSSMR